MKLGVMDRLLISTILPRRGGIATLRLAQEATGCVQLSADEIEKWQVQDLPGGGVRWNDAVAEEVDIDLPQACVSLIRDRLKEISDREELEIQCLPLYEKFVNGREA